VEEISKRDSLGLYLKGARLKRNMTLRDVEAATGKEVSNAYLSQLESGKITKPSVHAL
jgi:transcriptional regulator with XRE-family HTH domain